MSLKAILFDLDGTLLDTAPDFITSLNLLLREEGRAELPAGTIRRTVSNGASALVQLAFPELDPLEAEFQQLRNRMLKLYSEHLADHSKPFDGILDLLEFARQKNIRWGIVTNKPVVYTAPLLKKISFPVAPDTVICPDHVTHPKPHPEPLLLACRQVACTHTEAIYLGDHRRDIESAHNARMRTIACAYGYVEESEDIYHWQADHVIHDPREAIPLISALL